MRSVRADQLRRYDVAPVYGKVLKVTPSPYTSKRTTVEFENSRVSVPNDYPFNITRPSAKR